MQNNLNELTTQVRRDILRMVHKVNSGHPGGSLGCAEFLVVLYNEIMIRKEDFDMDGINEDIFFLSNGHISPVFYSVLARTGYFPVEELNTFRLLDSRLQGHPTTHEGLPGIRIASGSLGQGLSVAIGAAEAKKLNNDSNLVYVLMGDGELQEGQNWEAIMYAAGKKVDNLIATIDLNEKQIDGPTNEVMPMGDIGEKRYNQFMPLTDVKKLIQTKYSLTNDSYKTSGPATYVHCHETDQKIGFITPHTHNFCESCNRVRITCTGEMYMCLGQQDKADLKTPLRKSNNNDFLKETIYEAISRKPKGHDFVIERKKDEKFVPRHMTVTGG